MTLSPINLEGRSPLMRLRLAVADELEKPSGDAIDRADAVIRFVVEACCKKLEQEAEELGDEGDLYAGAYLSAEADLRNTFLPTTEPGR